MRRQIVGPIAAVANSNALPVDRQTNPVNIGIAVVVTGTLTYSVQYTYDDVQDATVTPTWFTLAALSAKTATTDAAITFPCAAIRLSVTAFTSGGATMTVLQPDKC